MTVKSVMAELKAKGTEKARIMYARHGTPIDRSYGVSVADMKTVAKKIKGEQALALELYKTGVMEAMYLAGMVADGKKMSAKELQSWADGAAGIQMVAEYTVPWVTVESEHADAMAAKWIKAKGEQVAASGWCTYSGLAATRANDALDLPRFETLLSVVEKDIHGAKNRVRYTMNGFVISMGIYVTPLADQAKAAAGRIGNVSVDVGDTACEVPRAQAYIAKAEAAGRSGVKKKTIRC